MNRLRAAWRYQRWLLVGFVLALLVTFGLAARMVARAIYWADPAHRDQVVQGWMTPGYVTRSWSLPRDTLEGVLGPAGGPISHDTLEMIAADRGVPLPDLLAEVEAALIARRAAQ